MSRDAPCSTALKILIQTSLLLQMVHGESPSTRCTSSPPTPRSMPTMVLIKGALSPHAASLRPLTRSFGLCRPISADYLMMVPSSLPTLMTGTFGSSHTGSLMRLSWSQLPPDQPILSSNPPRSKCGGHPSWPPFSRHSSTKSNPHQLPRRTPPHSRRERAQSRGPW